MSGVQRAQLLVEYEILLTSSFCRRECDFKEQEGAKPESSNVLGFLEDSHDRAVSMTMPKSG